SPTATGATWWIATATGAARPSWPILTSAVTPSTSPSRTGSTTSTSVLWFEPPMRSWLQRSTSSDGAGGTGAARWSPTATSTYTTTRRWRRSLPGRGRSGCRCSAWTICRALYHSRPTICPRHASCSSARKVRDSRTRHGRPRTWCSRSPSSGRAGRSTPVRQQRSPCTRGCGGMCTASGRLPTSRRRTAVADDQVTKLRRDGSHSSPDRAGGTDQVRKRRSGDLRAGGAVVVRLRRGSGVLGYDRGQAQRAFRVGTVQYGGPDGGLVGVAAERRRRQRALVVDLQPGYDRTQPLPGEVTVPGRRLERRLDRVRPDPAEDVAVVLRRLAAQRLTD